MSPYSPLLLPIPIIPKPTKPATIAATSNRKHSGASAAASAVNSSPPTLHLHFNPLSVPVIVTVSSTPARLPLLLPTLQSLKQQSYPIHRILVCLPPISPSAPALPDRLTRDPLLTIVRSAADYGPLGRLIEAGKWLEERGAGGSGGSSECWVVSVEDGVVYHRDTVAELVRHGVEMDGCVVGTAGYRLLGEPWVMSNVAYVRRWDERLMDEWEDEDEEMVDENGMSALEAEEPSKLKSTSSSNSKLKSTALSARKSPTRSQHAADSLLASHHSSGHPNHSSAAAAAASHMYHSQHHTSHSPSASLANSSLLYPVEPCDVISSFRAILFPPSTLPQPSLLTTHLHSLPAHSHHHTSHTASTTAHPPRIHHCPDELLSGLLSLHGVARMCLLTPLAVVQSVVDGKRGRGGGGVVEWMAWSEVMEWMVRAGWWPGWEVAEEGEGGGTAGAGSGEEGKTEWLDGDGEGDGSDMAGLIEEGETPPAGEVMDGAGGGGETGGGEAAAVSVNGSGKAKEERKDVSNTTPQAVQRVKTVTQA